MARINIDDDVESRPEYRRLLKLVNYDDDKALGLLVRFWRVAQRFWGKNQLVPLEEIENWDFHLIIESRWGIVREDGVYAIDSEERFAWYRQACEAGKKGGRPRKVEDNPRLNSENPPVSSGNPTVSADNPTLNSENLLVPAPAPVLAPVPDIFSLSEEREFEREKNSKIKDTEFVDKNNWESVREYLLKKFPNDTKRIDGTYKQIKQNGYEKEGQSPRHIANLSSWLYSAYKDIRAEYAHHDESRVK